MKTRYDIIEYFVASAKASGDEASVTDEILPDVRGMLHAYNFDDSLENALEICSEIEEVLRQYFEYCNSIPFTQEKFEELKENYRSAVKSKSEKVRLIINDEEHEFSWVEARNLIKFLEVSEGRDSVIAEAIFDRLEDRNPKLSCREVAIFCMKDFAKPRENKSKNFDEAIEVLENHKLDMEQTIKDFGRNQQCEDEIKGINLAVKLLKEHQINSSRSPYWPFDF